VTGEATTQTRYSANIGTTAFEIDLFGRLRSLNRAAMEDYLATAEARNAAQISLVSEIANAYLTLLADRAQLKLSNDTVASQEETYKLLSRRFEEGVGTKLDVRQAETLLESARVDQIAYTRRVQQDLNALELLVGTPLPADAVKADFNGAENYVSDIHASLPSDLLQNRPDIRQAEHILKAANANIGAARAAFFPTISLTALGGTAATDLSGLFRSGSGAWSFIPEVTMPIFTAGRNVANLDVAELRKETTIAQYERAIQSAFREVSDALAGRATLGQELAAQQRLVAATEDAFNIANARYRRGVDNFLNVLDARRSLYAAQQDEIATRLARLSNYVVLYAALGGGQE
jgi:multidrug efflux system outer membrane protein